MLDVHAEDLSLKLGMDLHVWNPSHSGKPRLNGEFEACLGNIMSPPPPFGGKKKQPEGDGSVSISANGDSAAALLKAKGNIAAWSLISNCVSQGNTDVKRISQTAILRKLVMSLLIFQLDSFA